MNTQIIDEYLPIPFLPTDNEKPGVYKLRNCVYIIFENGNLAIFSRTLWEDKPRLHKLLSAEF